MCDIQPQSPHALRADRPKDKFQGELQLPHVDASLR
jgi:hypothetical protein